MSPVMTGRLPVLERQRASDSVYAALRTAILSRTFAPGQRLNVHALATELGVSLTPVKDALARLEVETLVEIRPRSGTFVTAVSPDDVADTFEIRCALECLAAEKALARATPADIAALRELAGGIAESSEDDDAARPTHSARNVEFHKRIVALSGSRRLVQMYESLDAHIQIARIHSGRTDWRTRLSSELNEHLAVVDAFERRDVAALVSALRQHIMRACASLVRDLRELDTPKQSPSAGAPSARPGEVHAR
jgi:DNA-binding GntR family transcriptional regulator